MKDHAARFWAKVNKTDGCWLWTAFIHPSGYGMFWDGNAMVSTHRFAYGLLIGPISKGLTLDHLCRVRACVNPAHLEPVTLKENILRGNSFAAENARKIACPEGHSYDIQEPSRRRCRVCSVKQSVKRNRRYRTRLKAKAAI